MSYGRGTPVEGKTDEDQRPVKTSTSLPQRLPESLQPTQQGLKFCWEFQRLDVTPRTGEFRSYENEPP